MTATPTNTSLENTSSRLLAVLRRRSNPFNSYNVAEPSTNGTGWNGDQVEEGNKKFNVVHHKTLNVVIVRCLAACTSKKCTKIYNTRSGPLFFS